ncbi:MAG: FecR domain-containing protein [Spirochaetota bacterium]
MVLSRRDKAVTAILVAIILILLYIMQCHWRNRFGARGDAKPVGEVEYKYHRVQRKYSDRMLWEEVEPRSPVYAYDWVMTKEKSDARITLNNGMKVDMDPESMVEIDETRDGVGLTLRDGTIRADTRDSKAGTITAADGTRIDLEKGEAQISTDGQALSVDVKEGKATLRNGGQETKAQAGEIINKTQTGVTKGKTVITLKSPQQEIVLDDPERPVDFAFEAPQGSDDCKIHLNAGNKTERVVRVKAGTTHAERLGDGTYHWRATCQAAGEPVSSGTGVFRMRPAATFALIAPQAGETVTANSAETLALRWRSEGRVKVELSENADFNPVLRSAESGSGSYPVPNLKPGKYWWRVTALGEGNRRLQSEFSVSEKGELLTEADQPKGGDKGKTAVPNAAAQPAKETRDQTQKPLRLSTNAPSSVSIEPDASSAAVRINWTPVNTQLNYRLAVSADEYFSEEYAAKQVSGKGSTVVNLPPGTYYYRVRAARKSGGRSLGVSQARKVEIRRKKLPPPPRVKSVQAE